MVFLLDRFSHHEALRRRARKGLDKLSGADQLAFLTLYHNETTAARNELIKIGAQLRKTFLQQFKELTKLCYVIFEVGATEAFNYQLVPGKWVPDMPLEPGMKAYSM